MIAAALMLAVAGLALACSPQIPPPDDLVDTWVVAAPNPVAVELKADCTYVIHPPPNYITDHTGGRWLYTAIGGMPYFTVMLDSVMHDLYWASDRQQLCLVLAHEPILKKSLICSTWLWRKSEWDARQGT